MISDDSVFYINVSEIPTKDRDNIESLLITLNFRKLKIVWDEVRFLKVSPSLTLTHKFPSSILNLPRLSYPEFKAFLI